MTPLRAFRSSLTVALAATAFVMVAARVDAAGVTISGTAPVVDGADIAMLEQAGATTSNGKLWTDTPVLGQTFVSSGTCAILHSITVQSGTLALATKTYSLRVGEVSGAVFTMIATESGTQTGTISPGDYVTFMLSTPVFLWADTVYGFDVAMTGSTTAWQTGIPYLNQNSNTLYSGGQGYSTGAKHIPGDTVSLGNFDRVFHLDLTATATPVLTLRVDPVTGETTLRGHSVFGMTMNYYQITSAGDSLDSANWLSLADQDFDGGGPPSGYGDGWEEAGASGRHALAEAFLLGDSTVGVSQSVSLGKAYDVGVDARDLVFTYSTDTGRIIEGVVEYVTSVLPGDANVDGVVDAADYLALKKGLGMASGAKYRDGDFDLDGGVDWADLSILRASIGSGSAGGTIPEPCTAMLLVFGGAVLLRRKGRTPLRR